MSQESSDLGKEIIRVTQATLRAVDLYTEAAIATCIFDDLPHGVLVVRWHDGSWSVGHHWKVPKGVVHQFFQGMSPETADEYMLERPADASHF